MVWNLVTMTAGEKSEKKEVKRWSGTLFITMVTWAGLVSWPGVEDTSASCLTASTLTASIW